MKKNILLGIGITLVSLLAFGMKVSAAGNIAITCEKKDLRKGESTTCNIVASGFTDVIRTFTADVNSRYLTVSDIRPNTTISMSDNGSTATQFNLRYDGLNNGASASAATYLASFTLTLDENAQNVGDGTCGAFCIQNVKVNDSFFVNENPDAEGVCVKPGFIEETCEGEDCDPKTGAFTSYLLLGGGAAVALVAILLVRKNSKFYNV